MTEKYSLYEAIKDKLGPNTRRKLEKQMEYNTLMKSLKKYQKEHQEGVK